MYVRRSFKLFMLLPVLLSAYAPIAQGQTTLTVTTDKPVTPIQPTMWGIFFEDINFGADGGLYAELIKNRSFEFSTPLMGWKDLKQEGSQGTVLIENRAAKNEHNPRYARITVSAASGRYGMVNEGFRGMGIRKDVTYHFSLWARQVEGESKLRLELVNSKNEPLGAAALPSIGKEWKKYTVSFPASGTDAKGQLKIWFEGKGIVDVDMLSLFPGDTWKNRPGGLRADLVQLLADMKPGFLRFPGGCIVEGRDLTNRYQWKKTIGNVEDREMMVNRWNMEFKHRPTPDYFQTFGLGFFEYFQLAEDIGASPLPILNCGMACQFNTSEVVPLEELDPYLQDALDLIEFANGSADTKWGKLRTALGHPAPFNLKLMGIGNEQWGPQYIDRYKVFAKAIKEKYPDIRLVTSVGPSPDGELFNYLNPTLRELKADIIDEHYYKDPQWFLKNANRYDPYDRQGPKIFAGEYAAQSVSTVSPDNKNTWLCALAEAAFMTGLERNADVVHMASYAPLFAHAEGWQWTPDLIWFDNLRAYGTPNYYVQKLFSNYKGTHVLPITAGKQTVSGQNGLYASAVWDQQTKEIIIKIANATDKSQGTEIQLAGSRKLSSKGIFTVLKAQDLNSVNSLDAPEQVAPAEQPVAVKGKSIKADLAPYSFSVIRIKTL
jgi:alpha-N-arabinofuranosidase